MAEIWLKVISKEPALTIETTVLSERECIDNFCKGTKKLKVTLKRFEHRQITVLEIRTAIT